MSDYKATNVIFGLVSAGAIFVCVFVLAYYYAVTLPEREAYCDARAATLYEIRGGWMCKRNSDGIMFK